VGEPPEREHRQQGDVDQIDDPKQIHAELAISGSAEPNDQRGRNVDRDQ